MLQKMVFGLGICLATGITGYADEERRTIFLDRMNGFEAYIERAMQQQELDSLVTVIEEAQHPDYKATLGKRFASPFEAAIFKKKTGRNEDTTLTLTDVRTNKAVVTYHFTSRADEKTQRAGAEGFVKEIKKVLSKGK